MAAEDRRALIERVFVAENLIDGSHESSVSPSGRYRLDMNRYSTGPNTWSFSRGIVRRFSDDAVIADVKRNFGHFWHAWVPQHPNGHEYLLCGEDYQGYSVVDLDESTVLNYLPSEAEKGWGFCWAVVYPSPDCCTLAVEGCYWACPHEIVFYDFTNPALLPLPELHRISGLEKANGWDGGTTFAVVCAHEARKSDGAEYSSLSDREQEELDRTPDSVIEVTQELKWSREGAEGNAAQFNRTS